MTCIGCDIAAGRNYPPLSNVVVTLDPDWYLCHSSEAHSYLGHLILSTREHRESWGQLIGRETSTLAGHISQIETHLATYYAKVFADPMERMYVAYYNETGEHHFHLHLFPRLQSMPAGIAWGIVDVQEQPQFDPRYRIHDGANWVNEEGVNALMGFLKRSLGGYSKAFNSWFVGQYGLPINNHRDYI